MTPRSVVNGVGNFLVTRSVVQYKLAALVALVLGAVWFIHVHDAGLRADGALEEKERASAVVIARLHRQKDSVGERIDRQTVTVTRTVHRLDTLWRSVPETLATSADTVKALESLPVLRRSTDEAIKACTDFQTEFVRYRTACDSLDEARRGQIDALNRQIAAKVRAGRWATLAKWAEVGAAAYVGFRVGRAR